MGCSSSKQETEIYDDGFPWDKVQKKNESDLGAVDSLVAIKVGIDAGTAGTVVARKLDLGAGTVQKAIVFDKVEITAGKINELHCLETTQKDVDLGKIESCTTHSKDELVKMALDLTGLSAPKSADNFPFPWLNVPSSSAATLEATDRLVARKVDVDLGTVDTVVAQKLGVGGGKVKKAIVFDEVAITVGAIDELHCLAGTKQTVDGGKIASTTMHSEDELLAMALECHQGQA
eukprot:TRINITY_DN102732_c0_g1_i1.p1 TRINITY_DN102732_c0_g1~~TRINITY_DN102732_c0_g1_i1.p1  ORF type:complete len:233 (-),score=55.21 TRINITY_DN102732_c0_g1_i1:3-701(-)